jgi:hypothetical protein
MSVDECIDQYVKMGAEIFATPRFSIPPTLKYRSMKKNTRKLEQLFKEMVESSRLKASIDNEGHFKSSSDRCKT